MTSVLRLVDRSILEKLTDAFGQSTGLPVAVLDPDGTPTTRDTPPCAVCARLDGTAHHAWPIDSSSPQLEPQVAHCRCGLIGVVAPLVEPALGVVGAVLVGPLLVPQVDLAAVRRHMVAHGLAPRDVRTTLAKVARLSSARAEGVATLFRGTVETVVQQAILANANVDLLARHSQTNRELNALWAVARAIDAAAGETAALQALVDAVGESLGVEVVHLSLVDGDDLVTTCTRGVLTAHGRATRLRIGEGFAGRVAATGEPITCVDVQTDPRLHLTAVTSREDTHAFTGVPIAVDGAIVGVLSVFRRVPYVVPPSEVALLTRIAQQAAAVIQRAQREEALRLASREAAERAATAAASHDALARTIAAVDRLTALLVDDRDPAAVLDEVARLVGNPVLLEDQFGRLVAVAPANAEVDPYHDSTIQSGGREPFRHVEPVVRDALALSRQTGRGTSVGPVPAIGMNLRRAIVHIGSVESSLGYLWVVDHSTADRVDLAMLERIARTLALGMSKQRAVARAEQRLRGSLLEELIGGDVGDSARLRDRAGHLGYDLTVPHALLVFDLDRPLTATASPDDRDATARAAMWRLRASLRQRWPGSIVVERDALIVAAAPIGTGRLAEARELAGVLAGDLATVVADAQVSVGVGRLCLVPEDFAHSYREARQALEVRRSVGARAQVVAFEDLGIYRLLMERTPPAATVGFAGNLIGPIERYDAEHGSELLRTLEVFLDQNGALRRTATALNLHVNTLSYRLQRIRVLTDLDLDDGDTRLSLHVAVKIRRVDRMLSGISHKTEPYV